MKKGFTLIEVLVVATIMMFLGIGIVSVIANTNKISYESTRKVMLNSNVHRLMMDIGNDVKGGAILEGFGNKLNIRYPDNSIITWTVKEGAILRDVGGVEKEFLFIGANKIKFDDIDNSFKTDNEAVYWKVDLKFDISIIESSGSMSIPAITNTFYCRTNPAGIEW